MDHDLHTNHVKLSVMSKTYDLSETELEASRIVQLLDKDGPSIPVEVMFEVEQDGVTYALLTPAEPVVLILKRNPADSDAPLKSITPEEFNQVSRHIQNALIPYQAKIEVKGNDFVLIGELDERIYTDCDVMELEEEDEVNEYLVVITVDDAEHHYLVALSIEPPICAGRIIEDERAIPLTDDELNQVEDLLSQELLRLAKEAAEAEADHL